MRGQLNFPLNENKEEDINNFTTLINELSEYIGVKLQVIESAVALVDEIGAMRLVIEYMEEFKKIYLIFPFRDFPIENRDEFNFLSAQLLQLNADRRSLNNAILSADISKKCFCLIKELELDVNFPFFIEAIEEMANITEGLNHTLDNYREKNSIDNFF